MVVGSGTVLVEGMAMEGNGELHIVSHWRNFHVCSAFITIKDSFDQTSKSNAEGLTLLLI